MRKLLLIGGGGHCGSVLDAALASGEFAQIAIVDKDGKAGLLGVPVIGCDDDLPALLAAGWTEAFVTVGSVGNTALRRRLYDMIRRLGFAVPTIADPSAVVARGVSLGAGSFIGKRAVVNTGSVIGDNAIINTGAIIEHDCRIGGFAHVSPGATLCGQVSVGDDAHVGAGAVVRQQITIGAGALIGAGSVVVSDVAAHAKAYGNPCRVVET